MAKTQSDVQATPGETLAPQSDPDNQGAATTAALEGQGALETLALAGDEAARRALGQPTASGLAGAQGQDVATRHGLTLGQPADRDVYLTSSGEVVDSPSADGDEPFRGTQVILRGQTVTAAAVALLAEADARQGA